jgi:hypothetical protein
LLWLKNEKPISAESEFSESESDEEEEETYKTEFPEIRITTGK